MSNSTTATWMLILITIIWGGTFVFIKESVGIIDAYSFVALRMLVGGAILCVIFFKKLKLLDFNTIKNGIIVGFAFAMTLLFQTLGMQYTTASNAGFITGMYVVFVPIFAGTIDKKFPKIYQILAVILAIIGLGVLTLKGFSVNKGDFFELICAIFAAIHIMMITRRIKGMDVVLFSIVQIFTLAIIGILAGLLINGKIMITGNLVVWKGILFCGIFATAFNQTIQAKCQRFVSEIKATMIYSFEAVFSAIFAFFYLGENLTLKFIIGATLIFCAVLLSEYKVDNKKEFGKK